MTAKPLTPDAPASRASAADAWARFVRPMASGQAQADFSVPGMHCAGCIAKIERGLAKLDGVVGARANLSTKRVNVAWERERQSIDTIRAAFTSLGFTAAPFDPRLVEASDKEGQRRLLRALAVAGFAAANIMLLSVGVWAGLFSDMASETRGLFHWISALIAVPAVAYAGQPFFVSARAALSKGMLNMDVPISLAVLLAVGASLLQAWKGAEHVYFDAAVSLLFFLLIGRFLDLRMRGRAGEAAQNLLALRAVAATIIEGDGSHRTVPVEALRPGIIVFVAPGMRIPADGVVRAGQSDVDMALLTGESVPESVGQDQKVFAGTVNLTGPLTIEVSAAEENTLISEVARLMEAAEQGRARFVRLADRVARAYAPVVHVLAALAFTGWFIASGDWHHSLMIAVAVLIITCPCALGLAVPVVQVVAAARLLRNGILMKSADGLERLADVDTIVFDKTGTLTTGELALDPPPPQSQQVLGRAAALARSSRHPLAVALCRAASTQSDVAFSEVLEVPGMGMEAMLNGKRVRLGRAEWVGAKPFDVRGPQLWFAVEGEPAHGFTFTDQVRPAARETLEHLKSAGLDIHLLSGDRRAVVDAVADAVGIRQRRAGCTPQQKIDALEALKAQGRKVLMVGDGLNDAPALAAAHVSLSPASAADISQTTADFVFQSRSLAPVAAVVDVARASRSLVMQNFGLALGYNLIAVPIALAGYATPLVAAIAMSSSSIIVTLNAMRLRREGRDTKVLLEGDSPAQATV